MSYRVFETRACRTENLTVETGKMCVSGKRFTSWYATATPAVLANVTAAALHHVRALIFFPLSVDFEEKLYAVGRDPGFLPQNVRGRPSARVLSCLPRVLADQSYASSVP